MLSLKECYIPYRNSMNVYAEPSWERIWSEKLQAADESTLYDIFGRGEAFGKPIVDNRLKNDPE